MSIQFTHLHVHSHYSLLNALPKIDDLIESAKKDGMEALALTDNGNMYGAIEFYKACKAQKIKPIIGVDTYLALRTRQDKQSGIDNRRHRLILLAKNTEGYANLLRLVTASYLEGFYYKPRIDRELLSKHSLGLVAISTFWQSEICDFVSSNDLQKAKETLDFYRNVFGEKNFFQEITNQSDDSSHAKLRKNLIEFAKKENFNLVASQDVYYINPEDRKIRDVLLSIQSSGDMKERNTGAEVDLSFISTKQALKNFKDVPEALENNQKIVSMCNLDLSLGKWVFPDYKIQNGQNANDELKKLVYDGIEKRKVELTDEISKRIEYELEVIFDKGYAPYFLVVSDLLNFAHKAGILTTIRGSVAGSMVTFLAGITNVNPIEYKLPFERFLNPERPSAPDIDMDYADNRRDEMIAYAKEKYGSDKVAQIGTFGTMMARGSVRDVARSLGHPYEVGDRIAKLIPMGSQGFPMTIKHALELVPELKDLYKKEDDAKEIIDIALKIEGNARHISVHAAGVVISPTPLTDFTPLQFDTKGENKIITQYDMYSIEEAGLLKFDFLGIKNLSILADSVKLAKNLENISVDIENVPIQDKKTFEMLAKGATVGLFQLNGAGMTKYLMDLKPTSIHDINAMVALYRPGPMESIPQYIERKHDTKLVKYLDPRMKDILDESYGVITYQDDVMMIAVKLGGYSWLEGDKLRKAMGKKIPAEMESQKEKLLEGLEKNGMTKEKSQELWRLIEPFAAYGFNKAHAASYGKVAYQTSYMKANFPAIYMSAVLTADSGDVEKIGEIIAECKRMGIPVLPPSLNESFSGFTVVKSATGEKDKIRFGLTTIKNFGEGIADAIIKERKENGKFKSLADFLERIKDKNLNKKSLEALIKAGALDDFEQRGKMLANLEYLLEFHKENVTSIKNQTNLFGGTSVSIGAKLNLVDVKDTPIAEKLAWEKELLGLYISGHPLDKYRKVFEKRDMNIKRISTEMKEGMLVVVGGIVEEVKNIITKKNESMCFMKMADLTGSIEVVVFPRIMIEFKKFLIPEKCVAVKGKISLRNGSISIIADKFKELV